MLSEDAPSPPFPLHKMVSDLEKAVRADLQALIKEKNCHGIMVRVAWHDAGTWCLWEFYRWGLATVTCLWLLCAVAH